MSPFVIFQTYELLEVYYRQGWDHLNETDSTGLAEQLKEKEKRNSFYWQRKMLEYRIPKLVTSAKQLGSGGYYPVCPTCAMTMERFYQSYCDRCGQCLNWSYIARHMPETE